MCTIKKDLIFYFLAAFSIIFTARVYGYEILWSDGHPLHWDDSVFPIPFVINSVGTPDIINSGDYSGGEFEAIRSAFQAWEQVSTSYLCFCDYGVMSRTITSDDGINLLIWRESSWPYEKDIVALTSAWYIVTSGEIIDADIEFNGIDFEWDIVNPEDSSDCPENLMDVQNITTHEIGHIIGLGDLYDEEYEENTMYGYIEVLCETRKRDLLTDDEDGVSTLYPAITVSIITPTSGSNEDRNFPVTISGTGFEGGAVVKLTQDRRPDITVSSATVISSSTISADLDLYRAPVGLWDVWVINPGGGGKGFLSGKFEVTDGVDTNFPPVADAGLDQNFKVEEEVLLDGSGSYDPDGDELDYSWVISEEPEGSSISLSDRYSPYPEFTTTEGGTYKFELVVDDGELPSEPAEVTIMVIDRRRSLKDTDEGCGCGTLGYLGTEGPLAATIFLNLSIFLLPLLLVFLKRRFKDSNIMSNVKVQILVQSS